MAYTAKQKSYLDEFAVNYLVAAGITREDLRTDLNLRERYNKGLSRFIEANPQIFDQDQIETAKIIEATPIRELETMSLGDAASVFFTEAASQADRINPFSALNLNKTYLIAGVVIVTVSAIIAYKVTPKIPQN